MIEFMLLIARLLTKDKQEEKVMESTTTEIDWTNPNTKLSKYFTVKEALWLPSWKRMATVEDGLTSEVKQNLITLCQKLDIVHEYFDASVNIHVMFRPIEYNKQIGGAKNSSHCQGKAADFHISGIDCDTVRSKIVMNKKLEEWNMRMEDNPSSFWVHLDIANVIHSRFFKP